MISYGSMGTRMDFALVNSGAARRRSRLAPLSLIALLAVSSASAQWVKLPTQGIPRGADGKPNLTAPAPRTADRKPDLSGVWHSTGAKYLINIAADFKPGELPIQPWAEQLTNERRTFAHANEESDVKCLPPGVPKIYAAPNPFKIIQQPNLIVMLYETFGLFRQVFMDGREPAKEPVTAWLGYSTGKWDGDVLVVDSVGFNGQTWLDKVGHPTSEALHVTERYRRVDYGHLEIQATVDDPKVFTKPWSVTAMMQLHPEDELMELVCENEKDVAHMPGK